MSHSGLEVATLDDTCRAAPTRVEPLRQEIEGSGRVFLEFWEIVHDEIPTSHIHGEEPDIAIVDPLAMCSMPITSWSWNDDGVLDFKNCERSRIIQKDEVESYDLSSDDEGQEHASTSIAYYSSGKLSKSCDRTCDILKEQFARAFTSLSLGRAQQICAFGLEAETRLLNIIDGEWSSYISPRALCNKLPMYYLPSNFRGTGRRAGGNAYMTRFEVEVEAHVVLRIAQKLHLSGSLDPSCKVSYNRPVKGDQTGTEPSTAVRFSILSNPLFTRDSFCVCRSGRVERFAVPELYAIAIATPPEGTLPAALTPMNDCEIYIFGIVIGACGEGRSFIRIVVDVDPRVRMYNDFFIDLDVRKHLVHTAKAVMKELLAEGVARG